MTATTHRGLGIPRISPLIGLALAALALGGCSALTQFDVPIDATGTAPGALSHLEVSGFSSLSGAGGTVSQSIQNQGTAASLIASAKLTGGTLSVTSPTGADLSWLRSFDVQVAAAGLAKVRIAHLDAFPAHQSSYDLALDDVELKPYVQAQSMELTPEFVRAGWATQDEQLALHLVLHVSL